MKKKEVWIATGGTGGHIFPALAVAAELLRRGFPLRISSDGRGWKYVREFYARIENRESRIEKRKTNRFSIFDSRFSYIWASGVGAKNPIKQIWALFKIAVTTFLLIVRFAFKRPDKIVAFGGYASVPVLIAGRIYKIPTFLHEQNASIGRANKFAMRFTGTLMTSFDIGVGIYTGLPVRKEVHSQRSTVHGTKEIRLLITGGSLGAKVLDDVMPLAMNEVRKTINDKQKKQLFIIHQTRPENVERLRKLYASLGIKNNVTTFIRNMPEELAAAALVISRAGASTVVEMQTIGVPAILVPLAINPDQQANAEQFIKNGGGVIIKQKDFTPQAVSKVLKELLFNPKKLEQMAAAARVPNNAVNRIVDIVISD